MTLDGNYNGRFEAMKADMSISGIRVIIIKLGLLVIQLVVKSFQNNIPSQCFLLLRKHLCVKLDNAQADGHYGKITPFIAIDEF